MSEMVSISTLDGENSFNAYVARPQGTPRAAIVVIQEIFGVNAGIRRKCDKLAEDGYLAVAPDLFWQFEDGIELDPDIEEELDKELRTAQLELKSRNPNGARIKESLGTASNVMIKAAAVGGAVAKLAAYGEQIRNLLSMII